MPEKTEKKCYSLQIYLNTQLDHYNDAVRTFSKTATENIVRYSFQDHFVLLERVAINSYHIFEFTGFSSLFQNIHCFSGFPLNAVEQFLY